GRKKAGGGGGGKNPPPPPGGREPHPGGGARPFLCLLFSGPLLSPTPPPPRKRAFGGGPQNPAPKGPPGGRPHPRVFSPPVRPRRDSSRRLRTRRLPADRSNGAFLAHHARRGSLRGCRPSGPWRVQRVSDPARGRTSPGGNATQPRSQVQVRARTRSGRADRH